jgi:hypothetical protein
MDEGTSAVTKESAVNQSSQRSYLAMMLLAFFAGPLGLARIYRGDKSVGWGRFWAFVGCIVVGMISAALPPLALLVGLVEFGLMIWGAVDFFLLYGARVDASNQPLVRNELDARVAKVLFILFIVGLSIALVAVILSLIFWSAVLSGFASGSFHYSQTY